MSLFNYECDEVKRIIEEVSPNYPQLTTYEKEWIYFYKYGYIPGTPVDLEYQEVSVNPMGTVQNAIPHSYKRAILKGSTEKVFSPLKNLFDGFLEIGVIDNDTGALGTDTAYCRSANFIDIEPSTNYIISTNGAVNGRLYYYDINFNFISTSLSEEKALSPSNAKYMKFRIEATKKDEKIQVEKGKVITDYEEPNYILQSVKMPVLTTQGKNLWDNKVFEECPIATINNDGSITLNGTLQRNWVFNYTIDKGTYCASAIGNDNISVHLFWKGFDTAFQQNYSFDISEKITRQGYIPKGTYDNVNIKLQLEIGTQITSYEPHKSNILTVNEDVELRGVGDVKDELNLLTGELTQRIGEVVLDGSESWTMTWKGQNHTMFTLLSNLFLNETSTTNLICGTFPTINAYQQEFEGVYIQKNASSPMLRITISNSKLPSINANGLKSYLSSNNVKVIYKTPEEVIKTVDLMPLTNPYEGTNNYCLTANIPCEAILEVPVVSTGEQTLQEINNY